MRRLILPLPFADITITLRAKRRGRPIFWYFLLSAAFHVFVVSAFVALAARSLFPAIAQRQQPPELVTISSAIRIEHRPRPMPAHNPVPRPRVIAMKPREQPRRLETAHRSEDKPKTAPRPRELAKIAYNAPPTARKPVTSQSQLHNQERTFEETIAQAKAANDPVAGAATERLNPEASKRYSLNVSGTIGKPEPEGILYPLKRWIDGAYVYYYVRYTAQYADGTTESGIVPWPIRFPSGADPFAYDRHRMPLPGPMPDYVASTDVQMQPLVKNCYDHRYDFCPIAHE